MNTYIQLLLVAAITTYIVDLSGFTLSWRSALQKALGVSRLRALPPFDCGKCATWWACLLWAWLACSDLSLQTVAFSALLSLCSPYAGSIAAALLEAALNTFNRLADATDPETNKNKTI